MGERAEHQPEQAILGKNRSNAGTEFIFGIYGGEYRIYKSGGSATLATATTGWHHFYIYNDYQSSSDETRIFAFIDGNSIPVQRIPGRVTITPGGKAWTLGNEWDSGGRSDFLNGGIDEVYFFDSGLLSTAERSALLDGGPRMAVVGDGGMAFQSFSGGNKWTQVPSADVFGWRSGALGFEGYDWNGAGLRSERPALSHWCA